MYYPRKNFLERVCTTWGMTNWWKARVQCTQAQKQENSEKQQQQHFLRVQAMLIDTKETTEETKNSVARFAWTWENKNSNVLIDSLEIEQKVWQAPSKSLNCWDFANLLLLQEIDQPRICTLNPKKSKWNCRDEALSLSQTVCKDGCLLSVCLFLTWKESPVLNMSTRTNSKYWSMDQSDSTTPSA